MRGDGRSTPGRTTTWVLGALVLAQAGWLFYPWVRRWVLSADRTKT